MRFGLNPRIDVTTRREMAGRILESLQVAQELGFEVIELSVSERMADLGLHAIFDREVLQLLDAAPVRFHVRLTTADERSTDSGLSNPVAYPRSLHIRRMIQLVEFFEAAHPMQLYLLHAGRRSASFATHLEALRRSLDVLEAVFPGLPIAVANDRPGTVLARPPDFLEVLDAVPNLRYVFNTGLAYHAVEYNRETYHWYLRRLERFEDRLAEIHWSNGAPGLALNRPLHLHLDHGVDVPGTLRTIGRNPAIVHLFDTVGSNVQALARERRTVSNSAR